MPCYFFDFHDGHIQEHDGEGLELEDPEQARTEAVRTLGKVVLEALPCGPHREFEVVVRSEEGKPIFRATITIAEQRLD